MSTLLSANERQLCTCRVGPLLLGVNVLDIQEVLYHSEYTGIPCTARAITGLINLRGQIATAIDLRVRLGVEPSPDSELIHVVVEHRGEPVSLLVDEIGDVITVNDAIFEPPPENVEGTAKELILGAYKLDEELLLILDVDQAISTSNQSSTERHRAGATR